MQQTFLPRCKDYIGHASETLFPSFLSEVTYREQAVEAEDRDAGEGKRWLLILVALI